MKYYVMDMGGTFVKYALMDEHSDIIERGKYPAVVSGFDPFFQSFKDNISPYIGNIDGIAISMPGRIDTNKGFVHTGGSFRFFQEIPFGDILEDTYHLPVTLANDGKCAAKAEAESGALKDVQNGAVLLVGTGIGGGIILNREVLMGSTGAAGEFSYMVQDFERFANTTLVDRSGFPYLWTSSTSASGLLSYFAKNKNGDPGDYDGIRFFENYDNGDPDAIESLEHFGKMTASGIYTIQAILDLERIAIGGGISARREICDTIRRNLDLKYDVEFIPFRKPEIVPCVYGNDANLIGALSFHLDRLKNN